MNKKLAATAVLSLSFSLLLTSFTVPAFATEDASYESDQSVANVVTDVSQTLTSTQDTKAITLGDSGSSKISIPESSDAPISLPTIDGDIHLTIPSAKNADYEAISTGDVVISGEDEATSLLIQDFTPTELQSQMNGIRIISALESPEADPLLEFTLDIPESAEVIFHDDGTVEISNQDGELLGAVGSAWAIDAEGKQVPTWYEYENGHFYQYVDHLSGEYAYPIAADPAFLIPLAAAGGRILFQRVVAPALVQAGRVAVQQLAKKGIKTAVAKYRSYTKSNIRHNLAIFSLKNPGRRCDAHHTLPVNFENRFIRAGFTGSDTIHHPKYLVWWEVRDHRSKAYRVNQSWSSWFKSNPRPSKKSVLNKRTAVLRQYPPKC